MKEEIKTQADRAREELMSMGSDKRAELGLKEMGDGVLARIATLEEEGRKGELPFEKQQELVALRKKVKPQYLQ